METRSYPDRWCAGPRHVRRHPFELQRFVPRAALAARRVLPAALVDRLLPVEPGT